MLSQIKAHQTVIITGGNSGLGYQCTKAIAQSERGWHIIIASRNLDRVESAVNKLMTETAYPHIQGLELDLASLQSVRHFVQQLPQLNLPPLKGLVCNTGIQILSGNTYTEDGFETTFGVNHLAHFLLVNLLLPQMAENSRIVFVSSGTHDPALKSGMPAPRYESPHQMAFPPEINATANIVEIGQCRYTTSKLCNLLCTYELARRLQRDRLKISVNAFEPGLMLDTQLGRDYSTKAKLALLFKNFWPFLRKILKFQNSQSVGKTLALLISNPDLDGVTGKYFDGLHQRQSSLESHDERKASELWDESKVLVGLKESI
jgi:light-dependent protochlorophyllide reductase